VTTTKRYATRECHLGLLPKGNKREGRERKEGRDGGGARQAKLLIKTYSTSDPQSLTLHQGNKIYNTKTIIQLQNQNKQISQNKIIITSSHTFRFLYSIGGTYYGR
jgi:hypothetical protein